MARLASYHWILNFYNVHSPTPCHLRKNIKEYFSMLKVPMLLSSFLEGLQSLTYSKSYLNYGEFLHPYAYLYRLVDHLHGVVVHNFTLLHDLEFFER